jgi:NAD-dependent dihydropyrimidine dehydrogenase PreA subunit
MNHKVVVICESIYNGNTTKIARTMAQTLGCRYITSQQALSEDLSQYNVIGFGSGIYFGTHHPAIFEVVDKLDPNRQDIFIFSSRGAPILGKYHNGLKKVLAEKGKNIVGEFSVRAYDETGPWVIIGGGNVGKPNENDLKKAERFVRKILPHLCVNDPYQLIKSKLPVKEGQPNTYNVIANETLLMLRGDVVTINQSACIGCGKCIKVCPLAVIELQHQKAIPVAELDCTLCRLCVNSCSERAINLHYTWRDAINVAKRHGHKVSL